jgi:integrase
MPLKIIAPRKKTKANNLYIRGSYLGIRVDQSCKTDKRSVARAILARLQGEIERGEYPPRPAPDKREPTFLTAANAYMEAGKRPRYVAPLIKHFGETPLPEIDQAAIDKAAMALYPNVTGATRNSYVYTPVSAILHHAKVKIIVGRPPGAKGRIIKDWLPPPDALGIIEAADTFDREFGTLLAFLLYTGPRIGGALNLRREDVRLDERAAWARPQKGQSPMDAKLREDLCAR